MLVLIVCDNCLVISWLLFLLNICIVVLFGSVSFDMFFMMLMMCWWVCSVMLLVCLVIFVVVSCGVVIIRSLVLGIS